MRNKVIDLLDQTIEELDKEKIDGILEIPPKDDMGDFAFPCFQEPDYWMDFSALDFLES